MADWQSFLFIFPFLGRNLTTLIDSYLNGDRGKRVTLENYLVWQLVKGMRNTLSEKYRDTGKPLEKAIFGKESHHERWRLCITDTDSVFGFALGSLFIEKSFNGRSKPVAQARHRPPELQTITFLDQDQCDVLI